LTPIYVLLGSYNSAMQRWDRFVHEGIKYIIVSPIRPDGTDMPYFKKGDVARY
jgi:hypothetical protein